MSVREKKQRKFASIPIKKLCGMAVLTALAVVFACTVHIPYFGATFLEYSPSDVPILIGSFIYGPVAGVIITIIVSVLQGVTVSASSGIIGILMNTLSTTAFVISAGLIYRKKRTIKGAIIALVVGFLVGVVWMVLWNIIFTPIFMGVERNVVLAMIPTVILPFNLLKYAGNAILTFVLYKATGKAFKLMFDKVPDVRIARRESILGKHICSSVEDTYKLAEKVANTLVGGEIILLDGDLGAGKTTFTKGLALALGVTDEVTSPTFTILNVYESGRLKLNHLDMYRIDDADEIAELGIEESVFSCADVTNNATSVNNEQCGDGVTVIEWNKFENLKGKLIRVSIVQDGDGRVFDIK